MADECLNLVKEQQVSSWNRATVADGIWLQQNTIAPLETRDEVIAGYIDNTLGGIKSDVAAMGEAVAAMNEEVTTMKMTKQDKIHVAAPFILDPETNELELAIDTETLKISDGELKVIGGGSEPEGSAFTKMQLTHNSSTTEKETVNIKDWEDTLYITDGGGIITTAKSSGTTTVGFKTSSFKAIKESVFTGSTLIYFDNPNGEKKLYYAEPSESRIYNVVPTIWYDEQWSLQKSNLIVLDDASFTELGGIVCLDEHDQLSFPPQSDRYTEYFYYIKDQETLVYYAKDTDGTRQASKCTGSKDLVIATLDDLPGDSELDEETNRLVIKNADLITDIETHKEKEFSYYCKETETLYTAKSTDDTPTVWYWEEHIYRSGFHIVETAAEVPEGRSQHDNYSSAYYCIETNQMTSGGYLPGASWYTVDVVDLTENRKELQIGINTGDGVTINVDNELVVEVDNTTIGFNDYGKLTSLSSNKFGNALVSINGSTAVANCYINNNNVPTTDDGTAVTGTTTLFRDYPSFQQYSNPYGLIATNNILTKCAETGANNFVVRYDSAKMNNTGKTIEFNNIDPTKASILDLNIEVDKLDKYKMYTVNLVPLYQQLYSNTNTDVDLNDDMQTEDTQKIQGRAQYSISFQGGNSPINFSTIEYGCKTYGYLYNVPAFGVNYRDGYDVSYTDANKANVIRHFLPEDSENGDILNESWHIYANSSTERWSGNSHRTMLTIQPHSELKMFTPNHVAGIGDFVAQDGGMIEQLGCNRIPCITMEYSQPYNKNKGEYIDNRNLYVYQRQISFMRGDDLAGPASVSTQYSSSNLKSRQEYTNISTTHFNFAMIDDATGNACGTDTEVIGNKVIKCFDVSLYNTYGNTDGLLKALFNKLAGHVATSTNGVKSLIQQQLKGYFASIVKSKLGKDSANKGKTIVISNVTIDTDSSDYLTAIYSAPTSAPNILYDLTEGGSGQIQIGYELKASTEIAYTCTYMVDGVTGTRKDNYTTPENFIYVKHPINTPPWNSPIVFGTSTEGYVRLGIAFMSEFIAPRYDSTYIKNLDSASIKWIDKVNSETYTTTEQAISALTTILQETCKDGDTVSNVTLGGSTTAGISYSYHISTADQTTNKAYTIYFFTQASY